MRVSKGFGIVAMVAFLMITGFCFAFDEEKSIVGEVIFPKSESTGFTEVNGSVTKLVDELGKMKVVKAEGERLWIKSVDEFEDYEGWVRRDQVLTSRDALTHFSGLLAADPKSKFALRARAAAFVELKLWDQAIADLEALTREDPSTKRNWTVLGSVLVKKGDKPGLKSAYESAMKACPTAEESLLRHLAEALKNLDDWEGSVETWRLVVRRFPSNSSNWGNLANHLATSPDEKARNGKQAVEAAVKACQLSKWKYFGSIATLASAYAEAGDFESACKWQSRAIELFPAYLAELPVHQTKKWLQYLEKENAEDLQNYRRGEPKRKEWSKKQK